MWCTHRSRIEAGCPCSSRLGDAAPTLSAGPVPVLEPPIPEMGRFHVHPAPAPRYKAVWQPLASGAGLTTLGDCPPRKTLLLRNSSRHDSARGVGGAAGSGAAPLFRPGEREAAIETHEAVLHP